MYRKTGLVFLYWYFSTLIISAAANTKTCFLEKPDLCSDVETCKQTDIHSSKGICECKKGHYRGVNGDCINLEASTILPTVTSTSTVNVTAPPIAEPASSPRDSDQYSRGPSALAIWTIVVLSLLTSVGVLVILARRYKWLDRLYQLRVRRYNTVLVSSLTDDDAPIQ